MATPTSRPTQRRKRDADEVRMMRSITRSLDNDEDGDESSMFGGYVTQCLRRFSEEGRSDALHELEGVLYRYRQRERQQNLNQNQNRIPVNNMSSENMASPSHQMFSGSHMGTPDPNTVIPGQQLPLIQHPMAQHAAPMINSHGHNQMAFGQSRSTRRSSSTESIECTSIECTTTAYRPDYVDLYSL